MPRYTPTLRPPCTANLPSHIEWELVEAPREGQWRSDIPVSEHRHGVIETAEPIDADTAWRFDLKELPE